MKPNDKTFERGMEFVKNMNTIRPGISNLYVFTLTDKDGNIKDEKYGMNLMTNRAMLDIYSSNENFTPSSSIKLYVGQGTGTITPEVNYINTSEVCFGGLAATNNDTSKDYTYPLYFSASNPTGNGLITLISRFLICSYPANITNAPDQIRISEYGIGKNWDNLWTHSHIYDKTGARADIYKTQNEVLTITVYMCLSFRETLITNGWANDVYAVITTNQIMFHRMFETNLKTYKRGDKVYNRTTYNLGNDQYHSIALGTTYVNSSTLPAFDLTDGSDNSKGYIDGFIYQTDGFMILEPQYLTNPENIELINFQSQTPYDRRGFSDKFGMYPTSGTYFKNQYPPITRLLTASAYIFDYYDNAWSNQVSVYNPSGRKYSDDTPAQTTTALPITYYANDSYVTGYIHQNIDSNDKIVGIDSDAVSITLYATDTYWDRSSWIVITNKSNIPAAAQRCRYWITGDNIAGNKLKFIRESDCFQLLTKGGTTPSDNGYVYYEGFSNEVGSSPQCDGNGWFMRGNKLYVPYTQRTYIIGDSYESKNTMSMTYGKYIVTFNSINNKIFVTDTTNATTSSDIPSPTEITIDWGSGNNINSYSGCYITESQTGIICMNSLNSSIKLSAVIDLRDPTRVNVTMLPTRMACAIYGRNKIAYVSDTLDEIHIYDVPTATDDGNQIPFPTGVTSIPLMFGHSKYVWISSSTYGYYFDIEDDPSRSPNAAALNITYSSNLYRVRYSLLNDMFIVYNIEEADISNAHYILLSTPQQSHDLSNINVSHDYVRTNIYYHLREIQPSTVSGTHHAAIILVVNREYRYNNTGANVLVYDFGQYLRTGEVKYTEYIKEGIPTLMLYGENIIWMMQNQSPAINWLPIKLTGTTNTITTFNTTKHVSDKAWHIGYTNQPSWGDGSSDPSGIPPGVPLAVTNGNGTIIGWE